MNTGIILTNANDTRDTMTALMIDGCFVGFANWQDIAEAVAAGQKSGKSIAGANVWNWRAVEIAEIKREKGHLGVTYGVATDGTLIGAPRRATSRERMEARLRLTNY
jgi:hypothetical protein